MSQKAEQNLLQLMASVLDRLVDGETFAKVVEETGITARVAEACKGKLDPVGQKEAKQFFEELLNESETLGAIADEHGVRTLVDLFYLHSAISEDSFIDCDPEESNVLEVVSTLPSAARWKEFIQVNYMLQPAG